MKVKTSELSGVQLDVAVAIAIGGNITRAQDAQVYLNGMHQLCGEKNKRHSRYVFSPSADWSQCGPLIDGYSPVITICRGMVRTEIATLENDVSATGIGIGITYTISFCRALVSLKLGDEVDIPDELMEVGE
ncbi:phage protein NinX family protein [Atlantibacter hermannii]|uniref:phage protein NinX family protein n=1 Tax=Atlantibacter hermannii TaxID=565 RepID=UPI0033325F55